MLHSATTQIALVLLLLVCSFAWGKGSAAERRGASLIAVTWLGTLLGQAVTRETLPVMIMLCTDGILALGFLYLAVKHSSPWLGLAMLLQSLALGLHASHLEGWLHSGRSYVEMSNLLSLGILLAIVAGTVGSWVKRARGQRGQKPTQRFNAPSPVISTQVISTAP